MIFSLLLALFPRPFRDAFGAEMRHVFEAQRRAARAAGRGATLRLWLRTVAGMAGAAWREHRAAHVLSDTRLPWYETLGSDVRLATRQLARAPLFAVIVVATIAIGIGGAATVFSALNALVLRPLPGTADGGRLVGIERRTPDSSEGVSASNAFYSYVDANSRTLDGVAAWSRVSLSIARGQRGISAPGNIVSGNYFAVLGVRPALGRFFLPDEDAIPMARPVVVVSYAFWRTALAGDASLVGRTLTVNGREYQLVGVAPEGFHGVFTPIRVDAWVPLAMQPHVHPGRDLRLEPWLWVFGRLRPGIGDAQARAELSSLAASWTAGGHDNPAFRKYTNMRLTPLTGLPDDARRALLAFGGMLLAAALLVTLIAGANVSSLFAARAVARRREIAVRVALGATRGRLARFLLTETLLLFVLGALAGTGLAALAAAALERLPLPADASLMLELSPDARVLAVSIAVALLLGIVFGIGPALRGVGRAPGSSLQASSARAGRRSLGSRLMIVTQVACSLILLTIAALFLRAVAAGRAADPRLDATSVVVATFNTEAYGYDHERSLAFYETLRQRLERSPAVERVGYGTLIPLTFADSGSAASIDGDTPERRQRFAARSAAIDDGYLEVLHIPIVNGRGFARSDDAGSTAIVNEAFVRRAWPEGNAVGRTFTFGGSRLRIVGVARDSHYGKLDEPLLPFVYTPLAPGGSKARTLFVRGRGGLPPADLIAREAQAIDPIVPPPAPTALANEMRIVLLPQRVAATVTGMLGGFGLVLAAVGLYGLVAYTVTLRTREIGVRMALGADASAVVRTMVSSGVRLVAAGSLLGLAASLLAVRLIQSYLLSVSAFDPAAFAGAMMLLAGVTLLATYLPARRAARVSPIEALSRDDQ